MPTMRTNVFDDLFNNPFFTKSESSMMKTDIKEHDNCYDLMIDLPGVKKEDIKAELNDGYLTVSAESNTSKDEKTTASTSAANVIPAATQEASM